MTRRNTILAGTLLVALAFAGCGERSTGGTTSRGGSAIAPKAEDVSSDLGRLVPTDAVALLYVANPEQLEVKLRDVIGAFDREAAAGVKLESLGATMLPGASQYWDRGAPCALAITLPSDGSDPAAAIASGQALTLICGMTDAAAAKKGMEAQLAGAPPEQRPLLRTAGSYLAFSPSPSTTWGSGAPAIAATAPAGDIALRVDLAALVKRFREEIDEGLAGVEEMVASQPAAGGAGQAAALQGMLGRMLGGLRDLADAAETAEVALSIAGTTLDVRAGFRAKAGSKLDRPATAGEDLSALGSLLPEAFPLHLQMRMDTGNLMAFVKPMIDGMVADMPEAKRARFAQLMDEAMLLSAHVGPNFAAAFDLTEGGMQLVEVVDVQDGAAYLEKFESLFDDETLSAMEGVEVKKLGVTKLAGVDVHGFTMRLDMPKLMAAQGQAGGLPPEMEARMGGMTKRLLGSGPMTVRMAAVENRLLYALGEEANMAALIEAVRGTGRATMRLAGPAGAAGPRPTFLVRVDLRELVRKILGAARDVADESMPALPAGRPVPLVVWASHDGPQYGGGLTADLEGIAQIVRSLTSGK